MASKRHLIDGDVLRVAKAGALVGTRRSVNLVEGANVTLTVADNAGADRVDVTVAASGGGGVASFNSRTGAVTLSEADVEGALSDVSFGAAEIHLDDAAGQVRIDGVKVLGQQGAAIANAVDAADALSKFNILLARLRAHGLIAT